MVWMIIFFLIAIVSFILALRSMVTFRQNPKDISSDWGVFLIGNPQNLTQDLLDQLYQLCLNKRLIISLERLFKEGKTALVIFGDKSILGTFSQNLGLLELEDYSSAANAKNALVWDYSVKRGARLSEYFGTLSLENLDLAVNEQFWWQVTLQPLGNKLDRTLFKLYQKLLGCNASNFTQSQDKVFIANVRGVLISDHDKFDVDRFNKIARQFNLVTIPTPLKSYQKVNFYQSRQLSFAANLAILLTSDQILPLISVR